MSKILILGATGMLGHKLCQRLQGHDLFATIRMYKNNITKFHHIFNGVKLIENVDVLSSIHIENVVKEIHPDFIINCIGIVKQLKESQNALLSVAINSYLPHQISKLCEEINCRLIHISTDCVFSGERGSYIESDFSDARDLYGKSKFLGETTDYEKSALTLRTSIVGRELKRPTHGLVEWFLSQKGKSIRGFQKAIYTGLTTIELANIIQLVIDHYPKMAGLHHVASNPISKYDLLRLIKKKYKIDVEIQKDTDFFCDRSLVMKSFSNITGYTAPSWDSMIQEMYEDPTPYQFYHQRK